MFTKVQAADLARRSGATVVIARGSEPDVMPRIVGGERVGTLFHPVVSVLESRKRFILAGGGAIGRLAVDEGAARALRSGGSLLPIGLRGVEGRFDRGDAVRVDDQEGREIARGLVNYAVGDVVRLQGHQSSEIEQILGYHYGDEIIHRNNMVIL